MTPEHGSTRTYRYADIQQLISQRLGVDVSLVTLRTASTRHSDRPNHRASITTGMPRPIGYQGKQRIFDADAIDEWLERHPRIAYEEAVKDLAAAAATVPQHQPRDYAALAPAVRHARDRDLSWAKIADTLTEATGTRWRPQVLHRYFTRKKVITGAQDSI